MLGNMRLGFVFLTAVLYVPAGCHHSAREAPSTRPLEELAVVEERWPNGSLRVRKQVLKGPDGTLADHGTYTRWYDNGQKEYEATFFEGRNQGLATRWHRNGRKWIEEHFVDGKPHGLRCVWDENGVKRKEEHHVNGKPHGTWTVWDQHGRIKAQQSFDAGASEP